ncbi:hypothetical protein HNR73_006805 [Phytomonospora endophytica]|uniref:Uncharacterized protein n=1 Tax=Phytomonospora endophytica TaxID=714109 RepID=A0A841FS92_9ACTN|nr:hypothetical protein [Phytomonospora endophytica]GIG67982.1 hypothetical protein Pen01_42770 [Phytomonospora endophytica]
MGTQRFVRLDRIMFRSIGGRLWERYKVNAKAAGQVRGEASPLAATTPQGRDSTVEYRP